MDEEETNSRSIDKSEEGVVQHMGYKIGDSFDRSFLYKMKIGEMDEDEEKDCRAGIGHGF